MFNIILQYLKSDALSQKETKWHIGFLLRGIRVASIFPCITLLLVLLLTPTQLLAGVVGQSPLYGGSISASTSFTDTSTNYQPLTGLNIRAGAIIDAIQAVSPKNYAMHGGLGGSLNSVTLNNGEYITGISGENCDFQFGGREVSKISFATNQSRTLGPYGTSSFCSNITSFNYTVPAGNQVLGFVGKSSVYLDSIGVVYGTIDPLAYYAMDENSWNGTSGEVIDSSGNGYNATSAYRTGSTYPTTSQASRALTGSPGTCGYGVFSDQQYLSLPSAIPHLSGNFTISAWFNTADASQVTQRILSDDQNNTGGYALTLNDNGVVGRLKFIQRPSFSLIANYAFQSNTWYFAAVSVSASTSTVTMLIYNQAGTLVSSKTGSNNSTSSETGIATIGAESSGSSETLGFNGSIDEARFYKTALTNTEIATLSQLRHSCPIYNYDAANLNCVAVGATGNTGHLYTQIAGTAFNIDVVALKSDGSIETNFVISGNKNVTLEFVDGSGSTACASRAVLSPTVSQTVSFAASDAGRKTVSTTISKAYRDLRCRVTDANQTPSVVACSADDFAVRPTSFTVTSSNANADSAGTNTAATPTIKAGSNFSLTATANATNYDGTPSINSGTIQAHTGATQTGVLNGTFPAATATSGAATGSAFTYSEVGYFRFNTNGVYDNTFTAVDSANGDCNAGFNASGSLNACNFGNTATTS
ncbi:MAG TPA: LamG-like jellyroll fold domain-containing protein, partial [Methylophilaceae bacterium]